MRNGVDQTHEIKLFFGDLTDHWANFTRSLRRLVRECPDTLLLEISPRVGSLPLEQQRLIAQRLHVLGQIHKAMDVCAGEETRARGLYLPYAAKDSNELNRLN